MPGTDSRALHQSSPSAIAHTDTPGGGGCAVVGGGQKKTKTTKKTGPGGLGVGGRKGVVGVGHLLGYRRFVVCGEIDNKSRA